MPCVQDPPCLPPPLLLQEWGTSNQASHVLLRALQAESKGRLGFVAGLIQQDKLPAFERLLFRATRGNMFLKQSAVGKHKDPASGEQQEKSVFVVFFAGDRARTKILKVRVTAEPRSGVHMLLADGHMLLMHRGLWG
jgi:hypothetical protein